MSLFACKQCKHVDERELHSDGAKDDLCTKCATGQWHDLFDYKPYNSEQDIVDNVATGIGLS